MNSNGGGAAGSGKREFCTAVALLAVLFAFVLFAEPAGAQEIDAEKTDNPDPVREGQPLTYTIRVRNIENVTLQNVVVEDRLPASVDFVSAISSEGNCNRSGRNVTCDLNNLAPEGDSGDEARVTIVVEPTEEGSITNRATISANNDENEEVTASTRIVGRNDGKGKDGRGKGKNLLPRAIVVDGQYDEDGDGDVDQDDEALDAENDLDGEGTDGEGTDGEVDTENFDERDDGVSATADENGAEASTPGALASAGDPDNLAPERSTQGDVVDEVPTSGPLPNTGGVPVAAGTVLALVLFGGGLLAVRLVMVWRERRA